MDFIILAFAATFFSFFCSLRILGEKFLIVIRDIFVILLQSNSIEWNYISRILQMWTNSRFYSNYETGVEHYTFKTGKCIEIR